MRDLETEPFGHVVALSNEKVTRKNPSVPYIGLEHLPSGGSTLLGAASAAESISINNIFREGDVLFGKLRPRLRKCVRARFEGYCSTDILVLRAANGNDPAFAGYLGQSDEIFNGAIRTEEGTKMPRCSWRDLKNIRVFCPAPIEQRRIASVLETIDEAIEQTEALIAKTQQIKAGLMHDLFTRGVLPNGELRPPRSEAPQLYQRTKLGWFPVQWELKSCLSLCLAVVDCKNRTPPIFDTGYPVIRTPNVRAGEFVYNDLVFTNEESYRKWTLRGRPQAGDILITREAPVGEVCMIPQDLAPACLGQRMMLYRPDPEKVLSSFMLNALQSRPVQKRLDVISGGSTVGHVRVGDVRTLLLPWTGLTEQAMIADALQSASRRLRELSSDLTKLQHLKRGLMHDLLTGRVRVPPSLLEGASRV